MSALTSRSRCGACVTDGRGHPAQLHETHHVEGQQARMQDDDRVEAAELAVREA